MSNRTPSPALSRMLRFSMIFNWVFQPRGPEAGDVFLNQRRVFIFPTRYGFLFVLSLFAMLAGSINYDLSLGFVLTFFLASAGLVAMLHTFRNQVHLILRPLRAEPAFAGDSAAFELLLVNQKNFERASIWLRCIETSVATDVPAGQNAPATLCVPALARGWQTLPRLTVETRYPLGLLRAWSYWQPDMPCLIYPSPTAAGLALPLAPEGTGEGAPAGSGTDDFAGLREHSASDSPRHIAWKSATLALETGGPLLTKHFFGSATRDLILNLAALPASLGLEQQLSQLTRWVLDAEIAKTTYRLVLGAQDIGPGLGDAHRAECLRALALYQWREPDSTVSVAVVNLGSGVGSRVGGGITSGAVSAPQPRASQPGALQ